MNSKDIIAIILAASIAIAIVSFPIVRLVTEVEVTDTMAKVYSAVLTAVIALIGVHIGRK